MASICIQRCQKCISLLRSKAVGAALQYSTQVQQYPSFWSSITVPAASSMLQRSHASSHIHHRWNRGLCQQSHSHAKVLTTEVKGGGAGEELSGADVVPFQQLRDGTSVADGQLADLNLDAAPRPSPFEEISDAEAARLTVPPALPPASHSLRDYVDESETLSKLVELGVNLWQLEQRPNVGSMLLRLDFQTDVAPRLLFLKEVGVEDSRLGYMISRNPFILTENLENLQARVAYLRSKKFSSEVVASMVSRAPYLLNFSVERLDNRLAFYQQTLGLSAQKTRDVVGRLPRLLCGSLEPVKENLQVCKLELGFHENDIQHMVTRTPKLLTANKRKLTQIFDYVHNTMNIPHSLIVKFPQVLNSKLLRIRERHLFLQYLGKAQYEPTQPNYIALDRLVHLPDEAFCTEVASATLKDFELFQKTL